jgi:protein SCO1/2
VRRRALIALLVITAVMAMSAPLLAAGTRETLPQIDPAPAFTLTTQENKRLSLHERRGKVVAITFIYTS